MRDISAPRAYRSKSPVIIAFIIHILSFCGIEIFEAEGALPDDEIIGEHNACDRAQYSADRAEKRKHTRFILHQLPWKSEQGQNCCQIAASLEIDVFRQKIGQIIGRRDNICRNVYRNGGDAKRNDRKSDHVRIVKMGENIDHVPNRLPEGSL